jgi:hypothetical protein
MTDTEWLACNSPEEMLLYLRGRASGRQLRLFAVACCRRGWDRITVSALKELVERVEQYVDRPTSEAEWREAFRSVPSDYFTAYVAWPDALRAALTVSHGWRGLEGRRRQTRHRREPAAQCSLLRDILGNLFKPLAIAPVVLGWQGGTVVKLAAALYEGRRWEDMPLLGDALEEAGCTDQAILDHCRGPGPHARGCHVVDAILARS